MASIRKEMVVACAPEKAWDAARDIGALHTRLVRGFVVDCKLEEGARVITFANGLVAREVIVDIDDSSRRLVWSATGARLTHHNASLQIFPEGAGKSRIVWIADLLPDAMRAPIDGMIQQGMDAMKKTLETS
jgi:hypothetical protein